MGDEIKKKKAGRPRIHTPEHATMLRRKCVEKRKERLVENGLCFVCGREPPAFDRRMCTECGKREAMRARINRKIARIKRLRKKRNMKPIEELE